MRTPALSSAAGLALALSLAACGGGGAIEDNLVRPGITAIDESRALACTTDAQSLETAIGGYEMLNGHPPADEQELIAAQYLREASDSWDIVDGVLVPQAAACGVVTATTPSGSVARTAPASELGQIVTATDVPLTPEELLASLTDEQIASVGGVDCARELVAIFDAGERYLAEQGAEPASLDELADRGYLAQPSTLWVETDGQLLPATGSTCIAPG
jgi:hypothetical protein